MRFCADICVHGALVRALKAAGADVQSSSVIGATASDQDVLSHAVADDRVLLTEDVGFGDLIYLDGRTSLGVVLVRYRIVSQAEAKNAAQTIMALADAGRGAFTTITRLSVRVRPLPTPPSPRS